MHSEKDQGILMEAIRICERHDCFSLAKQYRTFTDPRYLPKAIYNLAKARYEKTKRFGNVEVSPDIKMGGSCTNGDVYTRSSSS